MVTKRLALHALSGEDLNEFLCTLADSLDGVPGARWEEQARVQALTYILEQGLDDDGALCSVLLSDAEQVALETIPGRTSKDMKDPVLSGCTMFKVASGGGGAVLTLEPAGVVLAWLQSVAQRAWNSKQEDEFCCMMACFFLAHALCGVPLPGTDCAPDYPCTLTFAGDYISDEWRRAGLQGDPFPSLPALQHTLLGNGEGPCCFRLVSASGDPAGADPKADGELRVDVCDVPHRLLELCLDSLQEQAGLSDVLELPIEQVEARAAPTPPLAPGTATTPAALLPTPASSPRKQAEQQLPEGSVIDAQHRTSELLCVRLDVSQDSSIQLHLRVNPTSPGPGSAAVVLGSQPGVQSSCGAAPDACLVQATAGSEQGDPAPCQAAALEPSTQQALEAVHLQHSDTSPAAPPALSSSQPGYSAEGPACPEPTQQGGPLELTACHEALALAACCCWGSSDLRSTLKLVIAFTCITSSHQQQYGSYCVPVQEAVAVKRQLEQLLQPRLPDHLCGVLKAMQVLDLVTDVNDAVKAGPCFQLVIKPGSSTGDGSSRTSQGCIQLLSHNLSASAHQAADSADKGVTGSLRWPPMLPPTLQRIRLPGPSGELCEAVATLLGAADRSRRLRGMQEVLQGLAAAGAPPLAADMKPGDLAASHSDSSSSSDEACEVTHAGPGHTPHTHSTSSVNATRNSVSTQQTAGDVPAAGGTGGSGRHDGRAGRGAGRVGYQPDTKGRGAGRGVAGGQGRGMAGRGGGSRDGGNAGMGVASRNRGPGLGVHALHMTPGTTAPPNPAPAPQAPQAQPWGSGHRQAASQKANGRPAGFGQAPSHAGRADVRPGRGAVSAGRGPSANGVVRWWHDRPAGTAPGIGASGRAAGPRESGPVRGGSAGHRHQVSDARAHTAPPPPPARRTPVPGSSMPPASTATVQARRPELVLSAPTSPGWPKSLQPSSGSMSWADDEDFEATLELPAEHKQGAGHRLEKLESMREEDVAELMSLCL